MLFSVHFYLLYFLKTQIPSSEDTNCPYRLPFRFLTAAHIFSLAVLISGAKIIPIIQTVCRCVMFLFVDFHAAVSLMLGGCLRALCRDTWPVCFHADVRYYL